MGLLGRYIDALPDEARDRLIEAQAWCIAEVLGPDGTRCLIGHAENWRPLPVERLRWRGWMDEESGSGPDAPCDPPSGSEPDAACHPLVFAFRRAEPADLSLYRARIERWGVGSESRIGARFDRLCLRRGIQGAARLVKRRAARAHAPLIPPKVPVPPPG